MPYKINFEQLKITARGKWQGIIETLGINIRTDNRHCACPVCGGKDRARFDNKNGDGTYICGQHGAGDGFDLVQKALGCSFLETLEKIQSIVGGCEVKETQKPDQNIEQKKANLNKLWQASTSLTGSDPASKYFHSRGLNLTPSHVRYCSACYHKELDQNIPTLIARIQSKEGKPISLHRIYLQDNATPKKKLMPGVESLNGCAIRLFSPENKMFESEVLAITEGIENALATSQMFGVATWSVISSTLMESFEPPEKIRKIIIFADNDSSFAGAKSAYKLANRLYLHDFIVSVEMPEKQNSDWNDVLLDNKRNSL